MTNPFRPRQFLPGLLQASSPLPKIDPISSPLATAGNGPIAGYTNTFSLNLVNFDWITWHNYEWENWIVVDALLNVAIGFLNIKGFWKPNTDYVAGQSVFDPANVSKLYLCLAPHTSGTDFETEKPLYWKLVDKATQSVSSVFGRIGEVLAVATDYAAFYADLNTTVAALADRYTKAEADARFLTQIIADTRYLRLAGGTMTGFLTLSASPTALLHAANKGYVDAADASLAATLRSEIDALSTATVTELAKKLNIAGGTMTGPLTLASAPAAPLQAATKLYVDEKIAAIPAPVIPPGTIISDTAPPNPEVGQLWWRTAEPVGLFIWYQDTDSSQWVQVSGSAGGGVSEPVPAFATVPEALTGVVTDKIMSPALVQARSGVDIRNMSGTSVLFSNVPPEATEYAILIGLEYPANGVVTLDFINAPGLSCSWSRQLMAGSYAAPAGGSGDPAMTIDTDTTGRTLNGLIHMVRDGNGGTWRAHGRYRQSASRVVALDATVSMGGATAAVPRLNCAQGGGFISGVTSIRWRV